MGAVCILAPVVIAAWPAFSAAVAAAASSLGYQLMSEASGRGAARTRREEYDSVHLEIERSEVVTSQLGRDQQIAVTRDGVTIRFSRDARGKAALCVTGQGRTEEELRALGEELGQCVVQQYVYQKLMNEMQSRGFVVVEEETNTDRSIHLRIRHWEG
jgi:hypothetical protein